ncbi:MAG: ABC transporter permease [Firmicutes bacterium]|nr:ABC transporter permease [Bacillota bacterium]
MAPARTAKGTLYRKLFRQIGKTRGQFLSMVAVVAIGIMAFATMNATYRELHESLYRYYDRCRFNDLMVQVRRAPAAAVDRVRRIDGVAAAEGRLMLDARLDVPKSTGGAAAQGKESSITGRVVGVPDVHQVTVNEIELVSGRRPRVATGEVAVDPKFAAAHDLKPGDELVMYVHGKVARVRVCGTATSPEFIYATKDASTLLPDPFTFGILFMSQKDMASLFGYEGEVNQVLVRYSPGADTSSVKAAVDKALDPYGRVSSLERKDQFSHQVITSEFEQVKTMSTTLPAIFLAVGAAIMYISISRMVRDQRTQIGVMKALGYSSLQVLAHYTGFAVLGGLAGSILGVLGASWGIRGMMTAYRVYYSLPLGTGRLAWGEIAGAIAMTVAVSVVAGYFGAGSVLRLIPAEAMRPPAPPGAVKALLEVIPALWRRLSFSWKMAMRNLSRHKGRAALTVMGATLAVVLLVMAMFNVDAVDYLFVEGILGRQKYDLAVTLGKPVGRETYHFLRGLPGVTGVEMYSQYAARLRSGLVEEDVSLKGLPAGSRMQVIVDPDGLRLGVPDDGILLTERTADKLGVTVGDSVMVEALDGLQNKRPMVVRGIVQELMGGSAFAPIEQVNALVGESGTANAAWITSTQASRVRALLSQSPVVIGMTSPADQARDFDKMTGALIFSVGIMTALGVGMGFSIMYTVSSISIEERKREIAFLKALGLTSAEAASIVFNENTALSVLGIVLGLPLGNAAARAFMAATAGDLWTFPVVIYPRTYLFAAAGGWLFLTLARWAGSRRIARLEPTAELKTQE